jgi:hypothetical protein
MDTYNPLYDDYQQGKFKDVQLTLNEQNQIYSAQHWYPLLAGVTPESHLFELSDSEIKELSEGEIPTNSIFRKSVTDLITKYQFVKTTHKSAHAFEPICNLNDFEKQMTNANVIMSFRRYNCRYLLFRKWAEMNLECRVYVYKKQIRYVEVYRDIKSEFNVNMFGDIIKFVNESVIPKLTIYDTFTADVYYTGPNDDIKWQVVEINSPLWLKCGTYLIKYEWERHRIHDTPTPICKYIDSTNGDIMEV